MLKKKPRPLGIGSQGQLHLPVISKKFKVLSLGRECNLPKNYPFTAFQREPWQDTVVADLLWGRGRGCIDLEDGVMQVFLPWETSLPQVLPRAPVKQKEKKKERKKEKKETCFKIASCQSTAGSKLTHLSTTVNIEGSQKFSTRFETCGILVRRCWMYALVFSAILQYAV